MPALGGGPTLDTRLGWVIMESPSAIWFAVVYLWGTRGYPSHRGNKDKRIPVTVVLSGDFYNMINAYINARYLSQFGDYSGDDPFVRPSFYAGVALFVFGLSMNIHSDLVLINLRKPGDSAYKIPYGGLFKYVSSPNYLSELLEWMGWTLLSQSPAGLSFAVYTAANLVPRALSNHLWYQEKFRGEYPTKRKAFLPFLW
ncbi:3-oxo-5-alpha-steroid 4-dehydrogenase [Phytophthora infestans]|uniref:3-oxo-5-alpha-steroid 4-dehydrogenase n=1 Tax=Phytophthora infestans TaxID=4787 RepID=A0A833SSX0_PHYIN|nr:3-oxo-5-alpha-steroid 4-dehydrogenase [Phytophthora infestans]